MVKGQAATRRLRDPRCFLDRSVMRLKHALFAPAREAETLFYEKEYLSDRVVRGRRRVKKRKESTAGLEIARLGCAALHMVYLS